MGWIHDNDCPVCGGAETSESERVCPLLAIPDALAFLDYLVDLPLEGSLEKLMEEDDTPALRLLLWAAIGRLKD